MSREPCAQEASPSAEKSETKTSSPTGDQKKRKRRTDRKWENVLVFERPEYRVPFKLTKYVKGPRPKDYAEPEMWLQLGIESGLVEMGSPRADGRASDMFEPIGDAVDATVKRYNLEELLQKGIEDALTKLHDLSIKPKRKYLKNKTSFKKRGAP